jgi:hypothetical protein
MAPRQSIPISLSGQHTFAMSLEIVGPDATRSPRYQHYLLTPVGLQSSALCPAGLDRRDAWPDRPLALMKLTI